MSHAKLTTHRRPPRWSRPPLRPVRPQAGMQLADGHRSGLWTSLATPAVDLLAVAGAVAAVGAIPGAGWADPTILVPAGIMLGIALLAVLGWMNLYPGVMLDPVDEARCLIIASGVAAAVAMTGLYTIGRAGAGFGLAFALWVVTAAAVVAGRMLARLWLARRPWWGMPVTVVGAPEAVRAVIQLLQRNPRQGLRPAEAVPVAAGSPAAVGPDTHFRWVVLATEAAVGDQEARDLAVRLRARHLFIVDPHHRALADRLTKSLPSRSISALRVSPKLHRPALCIAKRALDFALASLQIVLFSPLFAAIAVAIRLSSPGPIFYGHERIGHGGRRFRAWKFRTMLCGEHILRDYLAANPSAAAEWQATHKLKDDPRVTKVGELLRRTSLDELPQLWNVLRGEMSLVGPRPIVASEVEKYGAVYPLYEAVTPGVTGLWQVSGRNDTSYEQRVWLDAHYVRNWSPMLDLYILARTIGVVARRDGAY